MAPIKAIAEFIQKFWDALKDFLVGLFVPKDGFWDEKLNTLKATLTSKFGLDGMEDILTSLQNMQAGKVPNFTMTLYGQTFTFIDMSFIQNNITLIHSVAYFVFGFLLIRYNLNNVYKMIRGGSLYDN